MKYKKLSKSLIVASCLIGGVATNINANAAENTSVRGIQLQNQVSPNGLKGVTFAYSVPGTPNPMIVHQAIGSDFNLFSQSNDKGSIKLINNSGQRIYFDFKSGFSSVVSIKEINSENNSIYPLEDSKIPGTFAATQKNGQQNWFLPDQGSLEFFAQPLTMLKGGLKPGAPNIYEFTVNYYTNPIFTGKMYSNTFRVELYPERVKTLSSLPLSLNIYGISSTIYSHQNYSSSYELINNTDHSMAFDKMPALSANGSVTTSHISSTCKSTLFAGGACHLNFDALSNEEGPGQIKLSGSYNGKPFTFTKNISSIPYKAGYQAIRIENDPANNGRSFYMVEAVQGKINGFSNSGNTYIADKNGQGAKGNGYYGNSTLLNFSKTSHSANLYVRDNSTSGVLYLSSGKPFSSMTVNKDGTIPQPNPTAEEPPFQKFEFTTNVQGRTWDDVSNVNQFSFPLSNEGVNDGVTPLKSIDGVLSPDQQYGAKVEGYKYSETHQFTDPMPYQVSMNGRNISQNSPLTRSEVLKNVSNELIGNKPDNSPWLQEILTKNNSHYRITGPSNFPQPSIDGTVKNPFYTNQYMNAYVSAMFNYYQTHTLYINLDKVAQGNDCLVSAHVKNGQMVFNTAHGSCVAKGGTLPVNYTNPGALKPLAFILSITPSSNAPKGSIPEIKGENTIEQAIFRAMYAASTVGQLPKCSNSPDGSVGWSESYPLSQSHLAADSDRFYQNDGYESCMPTISTSYQIQHPVYNVYSKAMQQYSDVYSYTFGDFLGEDGTIQTNGQHYPITLYIGNVS